MFTPRHHTCDRAVQARAGAHGRWYARTGTLAHGRAQARDGALVRLICVLVVEGEGRAHDRSVCRMEAQAHAGAHGRAQVRAGVCVGIGCIPVNGQ
jgi:hypothetical protein